MPYINQTRVQVLTIYTPAAINGWWVDELDGRTDEGMDGWMEVGCMDGYTDAWETDMQADRQKSSIDRWGRLTFPNDLIS